MKKFTQSTERAFSCFLNFKIALVFLFVFFMSMIKAQTTITIGSGTNVGGKLPVVPFYGYSFSEQIIPKAEINTSGMSITKLRFYSNGTVLTNSNNWTIYLGHTTKTSFTSNTDWILASSMTQVYSGTVSASPSAGWMEIVLTTAFPYNNTDNLVVAVDENAAGYYSTSTNHFRIFTPTSPSPTTNSAIYYQDDDINPDPATITLTGTRVNYRNQMQLVLESVAACTTPSAQPTNLSFGTTSATSIAGSFTGVTSPNTPSGYMVVRSTSATPPTPSNGTVYAVGSTALGTGTYVVQNAASTTFTDSGLTSNTRYYYYVFSYNNSCTGAPYYLTSSPLNGNKLTCAAVPTVAATPVTGITSNSATINWVASAAGGSAGTINYTVEVFTDAGYTAAIPGSPFSAGTATTQNITFSNSATTYYYRIKANNGSCDSTYLTGSFIPACAAPTSLAASATSTAAGIASVTGSFTITGSSPAPTGYVVVRSTSSSLPSLTGGVTYTTGSNASVATNGYIEYVGTSAGSWTSSGLSSGTTYYYFVFSYNNTSCSAGPLYSTSATQTNATTNSCPSFSSVISIGGSTTTAGSLYPTLTAAITDLSACGITQATTLSLNSAYTSASETFPIVIPSISGASATNTLIIKPASGVTKTISGTVSNGTLLRILNNYTTIDGSNTSGGTTRDLSITNTSTTSPGVILIGSSGATPITHVTLKNATITNGVNTSSTAAVTISDAATMGSEGYFNNITIQNNSIQTALYGIDAIGNTASGNGAGLLINGNVLSNVKSGIYLQGIDGASTVSDNSVIGVSNSSSNIINYGIWLASNTSNATVTNNAISNIISTSTSTTSSGIMFSSSTSVGIIINNNTISGVSSAGITFVNMVSGIDVSGAATNIDIYSNKISNIKNTSTSAYTASGILLGSSSTSANINVYNNMIWDVAGYGSTTAWRNGFGISFIGGSGYKVYYNTVNMATNQTSASGISSAVYIDSAVTATGAIDLRNNIFANNQTTGTRYAFYSGIANTVFANIDYNDYYSTGSIGYLAGARATFANWQTATAKDVNSINSLPPFVSATDLHIAASACTALEGAGVSISGITNDIDSAVRSTTTPDIGADEFNGNIPPKITSVVSGSNCGSGAVSLTANGNSIGAAITEYRWYSAITGGSLIGTSATSTWITPSISTTTNYYVVAYNGCESETRTLVTATINPAPTTVSILATASPVGGDACTTDYVKLDATGGFVPGLSTSVSSGTVNLTIPDNNLTTGVSQTLTVNGIDSNATITKVEVRLNITHAFDSDLRINLEAPNGKIVNLVNQAGSSNDNFTNTIVTSDTSAGAFSSGSAPFTGSFRADLAAQLTIGTTPAVNATVFSDLFTIPNGDWKVRIYDDANNDIGTLLDCSITITHSGQRVSWTPDIGLYTDANLTTAYTAGDYVSTLYAAPNGTQAYTAKATLGTCDKTAIVNVTKNKREFTGSVDNSWNNASNWYPNQIPDNSKCANIPAGKTVVINTNAETSHLMIAATGKTTISANSSLKVTDAITIANNATNDNLVLESDAVLLQENASAVNAGKIYAKRDVKMRLMDYTYWSSPVKDQILRNTSGTSNPNTYTIGGFSEGTPNNRIYQYKESNDTFTATPDDYFVNAKGYAIRGKSAYDPSTVTSDTMGFVGVPNNGSYSIAIQRTADAGAVEHGYNLIGNPYPSNIDFVKFYNLGNNKNVIFPKAWFWTNITPVLNQSGSNYTGNNYATITLSGGTPPTYSDTTVTPDSPSDDFTPTKNIRVGQGFIVQSRDVGVNQILNFDNTIRNNESGHFYNNKGLLENGIDRYWVKLVSPEKIVNTILVAHTSNATNQYDADYDADLLSVGDDSFYSKLDTHKLQIQTRNLLNNEDVIPLGNKYSTNGTYKITLGDKDGIFNSTQKIYLHDKTTGTYTDLTQKDYSFSAVKGIDEARFELVYKNREVLGTGVAGKSDFMVYRDGISYVITSSKKLGKIEIYDSSGRLIRTLSTSETKTRIDISDIANGIYVLKVENSGETKTHKIIK